MSESTTDVIDRLAGIAPGSRLDAVRTERPEARLNAQASYRALFAPSEPGSLGGQQRFALAAFVAGLHGDASITELYRGGLADAGGSAELADAVARETARGRTQGPYGDYPAGPLSAEGPAYRVLDAHRAILGKGLAASLEHAHLLVFHPRDASREALQALRDAGLSTTDIVSLSQLVAFLAFQIRSIAGLRVLAAA
jgi:CMD domain protein